MPGHVFGIEVYESYAGDKYCVRNHVSLEREFWRLERLRSLRHPPAPGLPVRNGVEIEPSVVEENVGYSVIVGARVLGILTDHETFFGHSGWYLEQSAKTDINHGLVVADSFILDQVIGGLLARG